ncbi:metaxin 1 [Chlorella sorokiniana]|uniref:Metaxin 1 n=1 Tax=Chlorella sorokiniana TaxID=3076 RepID=A0A2P6TGR0_CHLSO|nr:metaxin 1 [Chlorella sorokiniana]|eukprot:PRW33295.1 metaxin 1 [Chlorella sorokiniana]
MAEPSAAAAGQAPGTSQSAAATAVVLYKAPPAWSLPSFSVGCLQVEAYLRLAKVAFAVQECVAPSASPTGQVPALDTSADLVGADAAAAHLPLPLAELAAARTMIDYLKHKVVNLDRGLSTAQRAEAAAFTALVEARLQPALVYSSWCEGEAYAAHTRPAYGAGIPFSFFVLRSQRRALLQRFAATTASQVYAGATEALDALAQRLGAAAPGGQFFFGSQPSTLDALLFGCLSFLRSSPAVHPQLAAKLQSTPVLGAYVDRLAAAADVSTPAVSAADAELDWSAWGASAEDKYSKARSEKESDLQRKGRRWLLCAAAAIAAYIVASGQYIQLDLGLHDMRQYTNARPARLRVQAVQQGGDDLSRKFAEAARKMNVKLPEVEAQNVATQAPPRFTQSRGGWNDGSSAADKVRRQEQQLLSAWTSERGMQLAAGSTIVLVLLLLFAAGGPPSDARCTLPWC